MAEVQLHAGTAGATADAHILAAWERRKAALDLYNAFPASMINDASADDRTELDKADAAEAELMAATASTLAGVKTQLWAALSNMPDARAGDTFHLVHRGDFDALDDRQDDFDWDFRLALAAMRSLNAMQAQSEARSAAWEPAATRYLSARHAVETLDPALANSTARDPIDQEYSDAFENLRKTAPPTIGALADKIAAYATEEEYGDYGMEAFEELAADARRLAGRA